MNDRKAKLICGILYDSIERKPDDPVSHFSADGRETKRTALKPRKGVFAVDRRRYPRYSIEFPLTYSVIEGKPASHHWGLVRNAAEGGILADLKERIKTRSTLKIELYYAEKLPLTKITATAKVVWSDLATNDGFREHRYGLQFESIYKGDLNKLRILLRKRRDIVEITGRTSGPSDFEI
ncbi:MAG TPA: PilZ domain-containing protein [Thermodesulfobacteriota bacterium]|nr:PilZ domain-containing protein [Thermodesulfobacteriota bacterium]